MRQDVTLIWARRDFLFVAGKSKFLVEHFLMGILSRSWSFHIRTWTRNAKLTRLIIFISFKIWHRCAPRNTTRNAASFWISRYRQKVTSGSLSDDVLRRIDYRLGFTVCTGQERACVPWNSVLEKFMSWKSASIFTMAQCSRTGIHFYSTSSWKGP